MLQIACGIKTLPILSPVLKEFCKAFLLLLPLLFRYSLQTRKYPPSVAASPPSVLAGNDVTAAPSLSWSANSRPGMKERPFRLEKSTGTPP